MTIGAFPIFESTPRLWLTAGTASLASLQDTRNDTNNGSGLEAKKGATTSWVIKNYFF
jgi:hypothetical protein